jgi:hypothetical protein
MRDKPSIAQSGLLDNLCEQRGWTPLIAAVGPHGLLTSDFVVGLDQPL